MTGMIIVLVIFISVLFFSIVKAAGNADERLEEIHNAFIFKEDVQYEDQEEH